VNIQLKEDLYCHLNKAPLKDELEIHQRLLYYDCKDLISAKPNIIFGGLNMKPAGSSPESAARLSKRTISSLDMPYRNLGRTGARVSVIGLGGFHLGVQKTEKESIDIIRAGIDNGINFMDNCWDYNEGVSEIRMGKALLDGYRNKVFLMSKIDGHDRKTAAAQIDECLKRLQTETIDLMQIHEVIRPGDPEIIFSPGGSLEALVEAKKAGKIRFIGFTGHKSADLLVKMLKTAKEHNFLFDTMQMPLNVLDAHYDSFEKKVLPIAVKENIAVLAMKPLSAGVLMTLKPPVVTPEECLHYAMSLPVSTVITGCDSLKVLQQAIDAARSYKPLSEEKAAALLAKTAELAKQGKLERYKTQTMHDGTDHNPQWLGIKK
jgi:aryl-alcohol dehydrogenase-like predicted oxidoreductase